ncbi:hypothetical protein LAZ40_09460 [Cereibacter sphaeroides]|uniref:hypothetical protein n=1 Tax=Cereibacter sphaeroides TaxID=1063 RepID=UPI001F1C0FA2|nr:hypothetical protein [Cereibacter sphaeroides]MCE6959279.1 hypothetical protein [Cereibacter sphaeroides]MCE6972871.1 hypothetical protein [Cereibacter sphaeroides]
MTKTVVVRYQFEGQLDVDVPAGSDAATIEKIAREAVQKHAGPLSVDLTSWNVEHSEDPSPEA